MCKRFLLFNENDLYIHPQNKGKICIFSPVYDNQQLINWHGWAPNIGVRRWTHDLPFSASTLKEISFWGGGGGNLKEFFKAFQKLILWKFEKKQGNSREIQGILRNLSKI